MSSFDLDPDRIRGLLRTASYGRSVEVYDSTGSTMDDARAAADGGASDGHVVLADRQQSGRGAHGRSWESPAGTDLYFSIVTRPPIDIPHRPLVTLATGLGVAEAIDAITGTRAHVKWPNDVLIHQRKCAGVLVETTSGGGARSTQSGLRQGAVLIGIGLNVNRLQWPEELRDLAISLIQTRDDARELDRAEVLVSVLGSVERWIDRLVSEGAAVVVDALEARLAFRGERVRCGGVEGVLEGLTKGGAARIRGADGPHEVLAGTMVAV